MDIPAELVLDINELTIGDLEAIEEATGTTASKALDGFKSGDVSARVLTAVVLVCLRKTHPEATLDDARAVRVSAIKGDTPDPLESGAVV